MDILQRTEEGVGGSQSYELGANINLGVPENGQRHYGWDNIKGGGEAKENSNPTTSILLFCLSKTLRLAKEFFKKEKI